MATPRRRVWWAALRRYYLGLVNTRNDWKLLLLITLALLISKATVLDKPIWWSELTYFEGVLKVLGNDLNPFIEYRSYKPPLIYLLSALLFKLFGPHNLLLRVEIIVFSAVGLLYTVKLGRLLFNGAVALVGAILLYCSTIYFVMSEQFVAGVPLATLSIAAIYYYLRHHWVGYLVASALLVLTKETGLIVLGAIWLHLGLVALGKLWRGGLARVPYLELLLAVLPGGVFVLWMVANKHFLGWYLWPVNAGFLSDPTFPWWGLYWILRRIFFDEYRILLTVALALLLVSRRGDHGLPRSATLLFLLMLVTTVAFYWVNCGPVGGTKDYFPLSRYYLYLYPPLYLYATHAFFVVFEKRLHRFIGLALFLALSLSTLTPDVVSVNTENDLNHRHMAHTHRRAAEYLARGPGSRGIIVGSGWLMDAFGDPRLGYSATRLNTQLIPPDRLPNRYELYRDPLIVTASYGCPVAPQFGHEIKRFKPFDDAVKRLHKRGELVLVKEFVSGCEVVRIYGDKAR